MVGYSIVEKHTELIEKSKETLDLMADVARESERTCF